MITKLASALSEIEKVSGMGKLLEIWIEIWPHCHLSCEYCFNAYQEILTEQLLTTNDYVGLMGEFLNLGGKAIGIPGNGEPLHSKNYPLLCEILELAKINQIKNYVFTSGDLADDDKLEQLFGLGTSLMVKCNSFEPAIQDALVGISGYTIKRNTAIKKMIQKGFSQNGSGLTRLGLVSSLLQVNYNEFPNLFRWSRKRNVYPDFDTILPMGGGTSCPDVNEEMTKAMFTLLQQIDREEFGNVWEVSPAYVAGHCDRHSYHMYIDCWGNVSPCLGANKKGIFLGNIKQGYTLQKAWNSPLMRKIRNRDYSGKCLKCANFQNAICNSCLGRYACRIDEDIVETTGCWSFQEG